MVKLPEQACLDPSGQEQQGQRRGWFWKHLSLGHVALPAPQSTETWYQGYAGEVGEGCWARRLKA